MQTRISSQNAALPESGVSEVLGSMLLISVVIASVAIVLVVLMSQATPEEIPNVNFMTGSDGNNNLYLFHNGGDSLAEGSFSVLVDGEVRDDYSISDGSSDWSLGKNLILGSVPSATPHTVAVIYNSSGGSRGANVLRSVNTSSLAILNNDVSPDIIRSAYPPVISVPQMMQNLSSRSVIYSRQRNATISNSPNTYLKFTITQPNSTIFTTPACSGSNLLTFNVGDNVTIIQADGASQGFRISGIGNQIWELTADKVNLKITSSSGSDRCSVVPLSCVINHTMITGYSNFQSNFSIKTAIPIGTYSTALTVYDYTTNRTPQLSSQIINRLDNNATVITNISPTSAGVFAFQFDNATRGVYFAGNTTEITVAGSHVYP